MGGVCCKDGIDKQEETHGSPPAPAEAASAPTPALASEATQAVKKPEPAKEPPQQSETQVVAKGVPPATSTTPEITKAAPAAPVDPAQVTLRDGHEILAPGEAFEISQTSAVRVDKPGPSAAPAAAPSTASADAAPDGTTASPGTPATPSIITAGAATLNDAAHPAEPSQGQPQPRPKSEVPPPEAPPSERQPQAQVHLAPQAEPLAQPVVSSVSAGAAGPPINFPVLAELVQAGQPTPLFTAIQPDVADAVSAGVAAAAEGETPFGGAQATQHMVEANLSVARNPFFNDVSTPPSAITSDGGDGDECYASKVKVSTTRRSTHPTAGGGGGDASSSVSHSHSATSSQQPGSSAHQAGSNMAEPTSLMMSSSAAQPTSVAGETAAATPTAGDSVAGAEPLEGSSNPVSDPSVTTGTPASSKPATSGFMFGAPRAKEHTRERRKDPKRSKSQSSGSNASGAQAPGGSEGISGSKASGSDAVIPGGGSRVPGSSSHAGTMIGSSAADPSAGSMDMMAASTLAAGAQSLGGTLGSSSAAGISAFDYTSIGRRINKPSRAASKDAAHVGDALKVRSNTSSSAATGSSAHGAEGQSAVAGVNTPSIATVSGVPEVVPEGEGEGEGGDDEERSRSGSSRRSSSDHLSIMSPPEGSDVENVLMLICNIFQLPVALVAAYRSSNIFIRSTALKLTDDDQWRYSLAQWSMLNAYELRDVLMLPNAGHDERYKNYYCVKNEPKVKFFMASPLRSSTGELLGTLCMADFTERMLEPANLLVVNNLQTLVIRQLERDMSLAAERAANELATEKLQQEMMRALDHFEKCIMFVDTSKPGWEVLYTNMAWEHVTGIPREHVLGRAVLDAPGDLSRVPRVHVQGRPLQDFFMALGGASLDWSSTADELASRSEFTVHRVAVRQKPDKLVSLHLRHALGRLASDDASGELEGLLPKGLPGWVKARGNEAHNYFVFVEEVVQQGANGTVYEALAKHVEKVPGLELSHLLGKGGFGSVYYGTWNGMPVAVKMIDNRLTKTNTEGVSLEALMGQELSHPNIVKTIKYVMRNMLNASSISGSNSRGHPSSNTRSMLPGVHSRNYDGIPGSGSRLTSRHGSHNILAQRPGSSGTLAAGNGNGNGKGNVTHPTTGMMSYMTSAQPGLSGMTSAQMAAAADLTSASAMQHFKRQGTTTTSDATTVAGGGSYYSGPPSALPDGSSGVPPRESNLTVAAAAGATAAAPGVAAAAHGSIGPGTAATSTTTTSGLTAVGPASVPASSASTAAGPPSIASGGGVPANPTGMASSVATSRTPSVVHGEHPFSGTADDPNSCSGQVRRPAAATPLPEQMPPLAAPVGAAASITATCPPNAPPPNLQQLTPGQQHAAMTSRFSLAFSTITSNGDLLVPGKGRSPSTSSGAGHTQQMGPMGSAGSGEDMGEVWIIMEFCDRGSLQDALDRGALKLRKPSGEIGETHLPMMVSTACEVASALHYLHERGIVHGDLTAWNVMLCTAQGGLQDRSGRNFVAKVADFGLSRTLDVRSKIKTRTYGTISHMPPECLISGIISKATDVFAFGVLLWQMYTGLRPWAGMNHGQIIYNVGMKNVQLLFPPGTPPAIADLSSSCTRTDPTQRPSFGEILEKLDGIRASLGL